MRSTASTADRQARRRHRPPVGPCRAGHRRRPAGSAERGSAPVEFVLVGTLLTVLFAGLLQLGFAMHVRDVLAASAAAGARLGADANRTPADGAALTRSLVTGALSARYARDVSGGLVTAGGVIEVVVTVRAPLPVFGPFGPAGALSVTGHAVAEAP